MSDPSHDHEAGPEDGDRPAGPPRGALLALLALVLLVAGGIWLARTLHGVGRLQDCVMAGRRNCAPIAASPSGN